MFASAPPRRRAGEPWLEPGHRAGGGGYGGGRGRRRRRSPLTYLVPLLLIAAVAGVVVAVVHHNRQTDRQRDRAAKFVKAYAARDTTEMYASLDSASKRRYPRAAFDSELKRADAAAAVVTRRAGTA